SSSHLHYYHFLLFCCLHYIYLAFCITVSYFFFFYETPTPEFYTLSLHDALPISTASSLPRLWDSNPSTPWCKQEACFCSGPPARSEEHTSELQSRFDLVCRLLLEKKNL